MAEVKRALEAARGLARYGVAHRYSMVAGARHRVVVLETGRVTETGTVEELRFGQGWFARFARRARVEA